MEYRLVVVGAGSVGKSAITVQFIQGKFIDPTIEDSYRKQFEVDGNACVLEIMDTAGQEEFSALRDQYMKEGEGFFLVYSIISATSFDYAQRLRVKILRIKEGIPDIPIMLIGNKVDLEEKRAVEKDEAQKWADENKAGFMEASAKTNTNISESFVGLVRQVNTWRAQYPTDQEKKKHKLCNLL